MDLNRNTCGSMKLCKTKLMTLHWEQILMKTIDRNEKLHNSYTATRQPHQPTRIQNGGGGCLTLHLQG